MPNKDSFLSFSAVMVSTHYPVNEHDPVLPLFFPSSLVQFMVLRGYELDALLSGTELEPVALELPETRASFKQVRRLIANAEKAWGAPGLGLEFGSSLNVVSLGMIGQAALSSGTIGEALETIIRYLTLRDPLQNFSIERQTNGVQFVFTSPIALGGAKHFIIEASFSATRVFASQLAGADVSGIEFEVQSGRGHEQLYEKILGPNVRFDTSRDMFRVPLDVLKLIVPTANVMSAREARQYCDAELLRMGSSPSFGSVVRTLIKSSLRTPPSEIQAAKILGHSERNLRRRLAIEATGYRELVREVRQEAAKTWLTTTHLRVEAIALELGYKNVGNFCRAFKRWTGKTPSEFRRSLAKNMSAHI